LPAVGGVAGDDQRHNQHKRDEREPGERVVANSRADQRRGFGAAGKITFGASCIGPGASELGCAWVLSEPDYGTGFRLGSTFLNKFGADSGTVSLGNDSLGQVTLLGPMNVKVTLIDNAGNRSNSVVVAVAHWVQM
jgi:hypothetical protein